LDRVEGAQRRLLVTREGSDSFGHGAIAYSHSQRPVPGDFPLFKRCEWIVFY